MPTYGAFEEALKEVFGPTVTVKTTAGLAACNLWRQGGDYYIKISALSTSLHTYKILASLYRRGETSPLREVGYLAVNSDEDLKEVAKVIQRILRL